MSHHSAGPPRGQRRLQVITNSFKITGLPTKSYYQYDAFEDERLSKRGREFERRRIDAIERLQNHVQPNVFKPKIIYDGDAIAYSSIVLSFGNSATFDVNMTDRPPREGGQSRGIIRVTLKRVDAEAVSFEDLRHLLDGRTTQLTPRAAVAINLIQLILRQGPNLKYPNNVKAFFCRKAGHKPLGGGLEVLRGYYQSVRPTLKALQVNIDTSCGVIYQDGPMPEVVLSFLGTTHPRALNMKEGPELAKLKKFFKGVFVTFTHRKGKKKIESIIPRAGLELFDWNKDKGEGVVQNVTIQTYFREAHNITLRFPEAIGVKVGRDNIVPIELCIVAPDQRFTRRVPSELTKKMVEFSTDKPQDRLQALRHGLTGAEAPLDYASSPFVRDSGMEVATAPTIIDGKLLPTPKIQYRGSVVIPAEGSWNLRDQQFGDPKKIACWAVVDYSPNPARVRQANETFLRMFQESCSKLGMSIAPLQVYINGSGSNVTQDLIQAAREAAARHNCARPDLILVILPPSVPEIQYQVKRYGDILEGVVTQCVCVEKVAKAKPQYCCNVLMKINAKLGGINWKASAQALEELRSQPFIIMGADVGHPAPGMNDQPSVASLVASYDREGMKYNAYSTVQPPHSERIDQLQNMVERAVDDFGRQNRPPQKLLFFRDGLSEGEYGKTAQKEIQDIRGAIDEVWTKRKVQMPKPTLTYIVVGKHHHVRFFPTDRGGADRSGNCLAGLVADQGIGNPIAQDYYLLSHSGLLGTSRPSHYVVILDENFQNNVDSLQELSFALCHQYARATRSVSIPAPVYYADLVCGRAKYHFPPELNYDDSSASVTSGRVTFNLERWQAAFQGVHKNMMMKMFFM